MFKVKYEVHKKCIDNLNLNLEEEVIPIDSNIIIYDYVFTNIKEEYDEEYLWFKYMINVIKKHLYEKEWSILIIHDENIEHFINHYNPYLLTNLSCEPILLISLKKMNTSYLERI